MGRLSGKWTCKGALSRLALVTLVSSVVISCSTEEFRFEERACTIKLLEELPPKYETQRVTRFRTEQRLTGRSHCVFDEKRQKTVCQPVYMTMEIPYTALVEVDRNEKQRNLQIDQCTAAACLSKYGNLTCDVAP